MQFVGLDPLPVLSPNAELQRGGQRFDLHNDAVLSSVEYDYQQRVFRTRWVLHVAAWKEPSSLDRATEAGLILAIHGVRAFVSEGVLDPGPRAEAQGLDFIEYQPVRSRLGQVRFVFDNGAFFSVIGERCELLVIGVSQESQ